MNRDRLVRKETVVRTNRAGGKRPNKQLSVQGAITGLPRRKGEYTRAADSVHQASHSVIKASPGFQNADEVVKVKSGPSQQFRRD